MLMEYWYDDESINVNSVFGTQTIMVHLLEWVEGIIIRDASYIITGFGESSSRCI